MYAGMAARSTAFAPATTRGRLSCTAAVSRIRRRSVSPSRRSSHPTRGRLPKRPSRYSALSAVTSASTTSSRIGQNAAIPAPTSDPASTVAAGPSATTSGPSSVYGWSTTVVHSVCTRSMAVTMGTRYRRANHSAVSGRIPPR